MENTKVNTTNKTTDDKNTDKTKVSCNEIFKTPTTSIAIQLITAHNYTNETTLSNRKPEQ